MSLFVFYLVSRMVYLTYVVQNRGALTVGSITSINTEGSGGMSVTANYCVEGKQYSTTRSLRYKFLYESVGKKYLIVYDKKYNETAHIFYELALDDSISLCTKLDSLIDIDKLDLSFGSVNWSTDIVDIDDVMK